MTGPRPIDPDSPRISGRTAELFAELSGAGHRRVDRMFAILLALEWLASIGVALWASPSAWAGESRGTHPHVWASIALGGLAVGVPIVLALTRPGRPSTRQSVAIGQMLLGALLIHLTGGRPEAHFHVFVALAFLSLYRDWRVLMTASLVVAVDHYLRGRSWPMSVFGLLDPFPWRWAEHSLWVAFEDVVLIFGIKQSLDLMRESSRRRAEVEASRNRIEETVRERTAALEKANADLLLDVDDRRKAELEAHRLLEVAEQATRGKSEFLANMSHEIRTPMNAIIGMTEVTLGRELADEQRENLEVVQVAADSLLELIDDILDFSKIEAGKLDLEPIPFCPREAVESAARTLSLRASEKGLKLSVEIVPDVPDALVGDPHRLRQVLLNLMGNAIKFTAKGRVEVHVGLNGEFADGVDLIFSVIDEGIGIAESRWAMIFDAFRQADGSTTRRFGGTGLGLSISKRLVELQGGTIWVESEVDRGSRFHFTARFARPSVPEPREVKPPRRSGSVGQRRLTVLLVDDNELNRLVGRHLLERLGHDVLLASDGPGAVSLFEDDGPFDLVLMDVQLPGMDGLEATAAIREAQARCRRRCPIIALTASAMKGDRERCLAGGMDDYLTKPIRGEELRRLVDRLFVVDEARPLDVATRWALDPESIRKSLPMRASEMAEVVDLFRATCQEQLASMSEAIEGGDPGALVRSTHVLMGCLGMFAAEPTVSLATRLEEAGRSGNLKGAEDLLALLEDAIAGMQPTLDLLAEVPGRSGEKLLVSDRATS